MTASDARAGEETCSFCGKPRRVVRRMLVLRARIIICDSCVIELASSFANLLPIGSGAVCVLCGKGERQRRWFRRGLPIPMFPHPSGMAVCAECLRLCGQILEEYGIRV